MRSAPLYLLDTNTVSYLVGKTYPRVRERFTSLRGRAEISISAVTEAELRFGAARIQSSRLLTDIEALLSALPTLAWDGAAAKQYALLRSEMMCDGKMLTTIDMMIAAHALSLGAVLVTHDRAFQHAPSLSLADWMDPVADRTPG